MMLHPVPDHDHDEVGKELKREGPLRRQVDERSLPHPALSNDRSQRFVAQHVELSCQESAALHQARNASQLEVDVVPQDIPLNGGRNNLPVALQEETEPKDPARSGMQGCTRKNQLSSSSPEGLAHRAYLSALLEEAISVGERKMRCGFEHV